MRSRGSPTPATLCLLTLPESRFKARRLAHDRVNFRYYELPTISRSIPFARIWLDGAMRAGINDRAAHQATSTLYLDKRAFRAALRLPHEGTIYALLVDRMGQVHWRADGMFTEEKGQALHRILNEQPDRQTA